MPLDSAALTQHIERRHERLRDWRQVALKEFEKLVAEESRYGDIVFTENTEVPANNAANKEAIKDAEARLAKIGRLLIRKSGTEPLIRVMAEGEDPKLVLDIVDELVDTIQRTQTV